MESRPDRSFGKGESIHIHVPASLTALAVFCFMAGTMGSVSFLSSSIRLSVYTALPIKIALLVLGGCSSSCLIIAGMGFLEGDRRRGFLLCMIQACFMLARGALNVYAISFGKLLPLDLFDLILPCFLVSSSYLVLRDVSATGTERGKLLPFRPSSHAGMMALRSVTEKFHGVFGILQLALVLISALAVTQILSSPWEAAIKAGAATLKDASYMIEPNLEYFLRIFPADASEAKLTARFLLYERIAPLSIVFVVFFAFVPIIVAFGSAPSFASEITNGTAKLDLTRMSRKSYYAGKFLSELVVNSGAMVLLSVLAFLHVLTGFRYCADPLILVSVAEFGLAIVIYSIAWTGFTVMISSVSGSAPSAFRRIAAAMAVLAAILLATTPGSPVPDLKMAGWFLPVIAGGYLFDAAFPMRLTAGMVMLAYALVYYQIGLFFFARRSV